MKTVYQYRSYKNYLVDTLAARSRDVPAQRSKLARAMGCQTAYISQVLSGKAHLSLEQGEKANGYLGHSSNEGMYFLTLILFERAGTATLKKIFQTQLEALAEQQLHLGKRLKYKKSLSAQDQYTYYQSWEYAAIHVLVSIPQLCTKAAISDFLKVPASRVGEILEFLTRTGLVVEDGGCYSVGVRSVHIGSDSPNVSRHHLNWRLKAMNAINFLTVHDLH